MWLKETIMNDQGFARSGRQTNAVNHLLYNARQIKALVLTEEKEGSPSEDEVFLV